MELIFLGTPQFAVPTLESLVAAGHHVAAVFTQPDRPKGRGREMAFSPVKQAALRLGLTVCQPERIRHAVDLLAGFHVEAMVIVGYGQIIPQAIIDLAPLGIINVHASLLPKYRGAAPIQWAIANGETVTGVTTMRIDAGLDTGDMLLRAETEIGPEETAVDLSVRLAPLGADLLCETLRDIHSIAPRKQDFTRATYAPLLKKEDGMIDWNRPAAETHNRARGFQPWPGAYTTFRGQTLHIWKTRPSSEPRPSERSRGSLVHDRHGLHVICGHNTTLELLELQLEGRKRISAQAFLNGQHLGENEVLGS